MSDALYVYYTLSELPTSAILETVIDGWLDSIGGTPLDRSPDMDTILRGDESVVIDVDGVEYRLSVGNPDIDDFDAVPTIQLSAYEGHFRAATAGSDVALENNRRLLELVYALYERLVGAGVTVMYTCGLGPTEAQTLLDDARSVPQSQLSGQALDQLFWLQILSSETVSLLGREKLLSCPAWQVTELAAQSIAVVLYETPVAFEEPDATTAQLDDATSYLDVPIGKME